MSLDRHPASSLLMAVEGGRGGEPGRVIHAADDSYEPVAFAGERLAASTPFEGLFTADLLNEGAVDSRRPSQRHFKCP